MLATNLATDTFTVTRAYEACPNTDSSSTQEQVARTFDTSLYTVQVSLAMTAKMYTDLRDELSTGLPAKIQSGQYLTGTSG